MAPNGFEVPEMKPGGASFSVVLSVDQEAVRNLPRTGSKWDVYWADSGLGTERKNEVSMV
jgi:hypothetical protein